MREALLSRKEEAVHEAITLFNGSLHHSLRHPRSLVDLAQPCMNFVLPIISALLWKRMLLRAISEELQEVDKLVYTGCWSKCSMPNHISTNQSGHRRQALPQFTSIQTLRYTCCALHIRPRPVVASPLHGPPLTAS